MNILHFLYDHINNPWVGGGAAVRAYEIYKRLDNKGHKITVVSGKYPGAYDHNEGNLRFKFVGFENNYIISTFSYACQAHRLLRKVYKKYDVIIEDFAPWNPMFSYKFQGKKPIVLQLHHREGINIAKKYFMLGLPFILTEKFYPKKFSNIIVVSEQTAKKFSLKNHKVIPNGIKEHLLQKYKENLGNYISFIGRIDFYNKGLDLLLQIIDNFPLIIAGRGRDEKKLESKIKKRRNIKFYGFVSNKEKVDLISNAKFLVMPSRFEGQGIVALEAAALGKPVIVSDIPELKYVVDNGFGISFKSGNAKDLAEKIKFLWNSPDLIIKMGKRGREYAKKLTWDKIADQYEQYLLKIIKNF